MAGGVQAQAHALLVTVAGECVALPAAEIRDVIRPRALTRVPLAPDALLGVTSLRGAVLPVVSLARLLAREPAPLTQASRIVVTQSDGTGLLVDGVGGLGDAAGARAVDVGALLSARFGAPARPRIAARSALPVASDASTPPEPAGGTERLLCFALDGQDYAWRLADIAEILPWRGRIAAVAGAGGAMLGAIDWRGSVLPVVSLRALIGLPDRALDAASSAQIIAVIRAGGHPGAPAVGVVIGGVPRILRLPAGRLDPVPAVLARGQAAARIAAIGRAGDGALISVLSPAELLDAASMTVVEGAAGAGGVAMLPDRGIGDAGGEDVIIFTVGHERYGLPAGAIRAVLRRPAVLGHVPYAPAFVAGVIPYGGAAVAVIDQRARFGVAGPAAGRGRLLLLDLPGAGGGVAAFAVDSVREIRRIPAGRLAPAPQPVAGRDGLFARVAEDEGGAILLIDPAVLLDGAMRDALAAFAARPAPDTAWRRDLAGTAA